MTNDAQPSEQTGGGGVEEALRRALDRVEYKPGDHPVVPIKHDAFVREVRAILAALGGSQ